MKDKRFRSRKPEMNLNEPIENNDSKENKKEKLHRSRLMLDLDGSQYYGKWIESAATLEECEELLKSILEEIFKENKGVFTLELASEVREVRWGRQTLALPAKMLERTKFFINYQW